MGNTPVADLPEILGGDEDATLADQLLGQAEDILGHSRVAEISLTAEAQAKQEAGQSATPTSPADRFAELKEMTSSYLSEEEHAVLTRAYEFADKAHAGQCRKTGEPFIAHPVEVAIILADLRMDIDSLCVALLHDTVEDTDTTSEQLAELFNPTVAQLVEGVTKISKIEVGNLTDEQAQTMRKMFVAMSKDIRVVVIKLADRLHNMRTLMALREDRRIFKARETIEVYAPIAHRLGIESIKWELEDLAFFYLEPNKYKQIARMVMESRADREAYIEQVISTIQKEISRTKMKASIAGRPKHLYSIYQKMNTQSKGFSEIYDLIAVRIIVKSLKDCYTALGAVHTIWHPIPGRFKDYIAMPKPNGYKSLHTTVIGPAGRPLEVQIRTEEMHRTSEYGVAAHWRYNENGSKSDSSIDAQMAWLREMIDWQDETRDPHEFMNALKMDLAPHEVFVFTPKGEVMSLRMGSTPVDFAYTIHTEVGHHCVGAKVNGMIVPLAYQLKTGDRVEILTQKSAGPSRDWLNFVETPTARSKIRAYFSKVTRSDDLQLGRDKLAREMRKHGMGISNAQSTRALKTVAENMGYNDPEDMFVQIGTNKESPIHVANRLLKLLVDRGTEEAETPGLGAGSMATGKLPPMITSVKRPKKHETHSSNGVVVKGLNDVLVKLARCCNPVPGDDIMGFVTRGRGVSVHRADCPNAKSLLNDQDRIIEVSWDNGPSAATAYKVEMFIEARDRMYLLRDVTAALSDMRVNVLSCSTSTHDDDMVEMRFLFTLSDVAQIDSILRRMKTINGVFDATRLVPQASRKSGRA